MDDRYYRMCRSCVSEALARREGAEKKARLPHTESHRTCYRCRRFLDTSAFTRRTNGTFFSACKDCNRNFGHRRRAREKGAGGDYTVEEWQGLLVAHPHCPGCRRRWEDIELLPGQKSVATVDHIVPISKGGRNTIDNIQPLCFSCNSRKGNKLMPLSG